MTDAIYRRIENGENMIIISSYKGSKQITFAIIQQH